jgi:hypothetical protein
MVALSEASAVYSKSCKWENRVILDFEGVQVHNNRVMERMLLWTTKKD